MKRFLHIQLSWDDEDGVAKFGTIEMDMHISFGVQKRFQRHLSSWHDTLSMPSDWISVPWICSQIDRTVAMCWKSIPHPEWKGLDRDLAPLSTTLSVGHVEALSAVMEKNE